MKKVYLLIAIITFGFIKVQSQIINSTDTAQFNGGLIPVFCGEYTVLPILQSEEFKLQGRFINTGLNPISAKIFFYVSDSTGVINFDSSLSSAMVNPGDTSEYLNSISGYIPQTIGRYFINQELYSEGDTTTSDNYYSTTVLIDDSIYARDYTAIDSSDFNSTVGFQGTPVSFGQKFKGHSPSEFTSATFYLHHPTLNDHVNVTVYSVNPNGVPDMFIGATASYQISSNDTGGAFITLPFITPISVTSPNEYFVSVNQLDTNDLTLGVSNNIYTPNSGFYNLNGGGWQPNENAGLNVALMLRVNNPYGTLLGIKESPEVKSEFSIYPNPTNGLFYIYSNGMAKKDLTIRIFDSLGREIKHVSYNSFMSEQLNLNEFPSGIYSVKIQSDLGEENLRVVLQ